AARRGTQAARRNRGADRGRGAQVHGARADEDRDRGDAGAQPCRATRRDEDAAEQHARRGARRSRQGATLQAGGEAPGRYRNERRASRLSPWHGGHRRGRLPRSAALPARPRAPADAALLELARDRCDALSATHDEDRRLHAEPGSGMAQRLNLRLLLLAALGAGPAAYAQGALVDPTRPPTVMPAEAAGDSAAPAGRLQSIVMSGAPKLAVIDGVTVPLGGKVDGATLVAIDETGVRLKRGE